MTKTERTCPRCGLVFSSDKLDGLCPACLLSGLLDDEPSADGKAFWEEEDAGTTSAPAAPAVRRFSHFEILEELGRGGMGVVYRARDNKSGRIVAVKVLQAHHLEVPDLVQRFRAEVRAVTSLDHPHVLPVHEVGEYEGIPFFSMKLTTGGSLAHRIGDYLSNPREAARLVMKVARGVQHAHERGILHRDLKPGNILLDAAGEPFVCDFGLAKWLEDDRNLTVTAAVLGTPHYIAPEQASGRKGLTTAADIYSLGAILYELLTARPPFIGQSIIETLRLATEKTPERPSSLVNNVPRDLETICLKCLQREPGARYPSAAALALDLENWLEGRPIHARPVSAGEQLWRWARRNPLPASLMAAVVVMLAAIAVVASWSALRIQEKHREVTEALYQSRLSEARGKLLAGFAGHRIDTLQILREANEIHPSVEVRNLAIQALALTDIEVAKRSFEIGLNSRPSRSFDSNLKHIVEEAERGTVRILRLADGLEVARFTDTRPTRPAVDMLSFSPDDTLIAARHNDGTLRVWEIATQKQLYELTVAPIEKAPWYSPNFAFSRDSTLLAVSTAPTGVSIRDARSGIETQRLPIQQLARCLSFSPDQRNLAVAGYNSSELTIWGLASFAPEKRLDLPSPAYSLAWSPDGRELVAGCFDNNLYLFHTGAGQRVGTFSGHRQEVTQVLFSPAGDRIVSTSLDKTVRLWSLSALTQEVLLNSFGSEPALRYSSDGSSIAATNASSAANILTIQDASDICRTFVNGKPIGRATLVGGVAFSPSGSWIATATYEGVDLWDLAAGRLFGSYPLDPDTEKSIRFGDNDRTLLVGSRQSGLQEFEVVGDRDNSRLEKRRTLDSEPDFIFSNTPPGDRDRIALFSGRKGIVKVMSIATGEELTRITDQPFVWDVAINPTQQFLALSFSAQATDKNANTQIWSSEGKHITTLPGGLNGIGRFSPDNEFLKISGRGSAMHLYKVADWKPDLSREYDVALQSFGSEGPVVAGTASRAIQIWDVNRGLIFSLQSPLIPTTGFRCAFSPDGRTFAAHSANNILLVWHLPTLRAKLKQYGVEGGLL
jgi:eukaryotic-like serine/threonine-protein kinase